MKKVPIPIENMNIPNIVHKNHHLPFLMIKKLTLYLQSIYKMKIKMIFSQVIMTTEVDIIVIMIDMAIIDMVVMIIYTPVDIIAMMTINILVDIIAMMTINIQVDIIAMMIINILVDIIVMMTINILVNIQLLLPIHQPLINGQVLPILISIPLMMMTEEIDLMIIEIDLMTSTVYLLIYLMIGQKDHLGKHHFSKKEVNQKLVSVKALKVKVQLKF